MVVVDVVLRCRVSEVEVAHGNIAQLVHHSYIAGSAKREGAFGIIIVFKLYRLHTIVAVSGSMSSSFGGIATLPLHSQGYILAAGRNRNLIYKETFCEMYKFSSGKFRTYFISSTNCVILADELIRNRDLRLIDLTGLITPGAYLSFLNTQYLKKNTPVISRIFYEKGVNDPVPLSIIQDKTAA